jgi:hypothetical protein
MELATKGDVSGRRRGVIPQMEKSNISLFISDVSEEMQNRIIWWLKGLCFSLLCVHCRELGLGGQVRGWSFRRVHEGVEALVSCLKFHN